MSGNFLMINGQILHVIHSSVEMEERERKVWRVVTEELNPDEVMRMMWESLASAATSWQTSPAEVQPAEPADATAPKCDSPNCLSPNCAFPGKCIASWQVTPKPSGTAAADATMDPCIICHRNAEDPAHGPDGDGHPYRGRVATAPGCAQCGFLKEEHHQPNSTRFTHRYVTPADATAPQGFGMPDALLDGFRKVTDVPEPQELFRNSGPAAPRPLLDGPPPVTAAHKPSERCGDGCAGCDYCAPRRQ